MACHVSTRTLMLAANREAIEVPALSLPSLPRKMLGYSSTAKAFLGCSRWSDNVRPGLTIVKTDQHELASA
jgi:hypothetical protein